MPLPPYNLLDTNLFASLAVLSLLFIFTGCENPNAPKTKKAVFEAPFTQETDSGTVTGTVTISFETNGTFSVKTQYNPASELWDYVHTKGTYQGNASEDGTLRIHFTKEVANVAYTYVGSIEIGQGSMGAMTPTVVTVEYGDYTYSDKDQTIHISNGRFVLSIQYENGRPVTRTIESAVRMNILTSVNQTAANQTLNNCEELDCDLVETSAHIGARPEHEDWQGEVFSRSGTNPKYRPFSVCELGSVTGICGINCKHSFYPYFEGMEEHYTEKELDEMASEKVTYTDKDGRDHVITRYEGEQKLRGIERNIRHWKRQALTQEAAGVDNTRARRKIGEWQAAARDFTTQTGIARDGAREYVGTSGKQPLALKPVVKESLTTQTATAKSGFSAMTDGEYNAAIAKCAKSITPQEAAQIDQHELGGRMRGYVRTSNSRIINRVIKNNGIGALDADDKKTVEALQKAISKNTLEKDTVLIRNIKPQWLESRFGIKGKYGLDDFATDIKDDTTVIKQIESTLPGKTVVENKFLSCSVDATRNYFNKYGVTIEIHAPKGTHCYFPNNKPESEAILDIGQKLKIISAKVNADRVNVVCELITEVEK